MQDREIQDAVSRERDATAQEAGLYEPGRQTIEIDFRDLELERGGNQAPLQIRVNFPRFRGDSSGNEGAGLIESVGRSHAEDESAETGEQKLPVIIFSHGAGGCKENYRPLVDYWVAHGYVCIQPTHGDSLSLREEEDRNFRQLMRSVSLGEYVIERADDISLVLDNFEHIENQIEVLSGRLDQERIGMSGHSYGAYTTQMIGGLSVRTGLRRRTTKTDERPKALLMISPQGTGGVIDETSWDNVTRPAMIVTGSNDKGRLGQDYTWRLEPWENISSETKFLCFIEEANHNFGGISGAWYPGVGRANERHVEYVRNSTLAFWDALLLEESEAIEYLNSDQLQSVSDGTARISRE